MMHRDRVGGSSGRRKGAGDAAHRQNFSTPPTGRIRDRNGCLPRLSDGVAHAFRCPASPQRTLLAENLGKPSLWVMISAPWYWSIRSCGCVHRIVTVRGALELLFPTPALLIHGNGALPLREQGIKDRPGGFPVGGFANQPMNTGRVPCESRP